MSCVAGSCQYPYSSAHLYVYLCPSFNQGCSANFFALDQMCSPITAPQPGTCYDTGFEIAGRGVARAESLIAAIRLAHQIAERRLRLSAAA